MAAKETPVMRQHADAKRAHPDRIVFFRLGDFYEMFGDDAVVASKALDLVLTSRNKGAPDEIPMCGVPHHAAHTHIARLLELGHSIAICEQLADPSKCKGIVPREVVRVISPGLVTDREHLEAEKNNWLLALDLDKSGLGLALFDISTGELAIGTLSGMTEVLPEVMRAQPREVIIGSPSAEDASETKRFLRRLYPNLTLREDEPLPTERGAWALPEELERLDVQATEERAAARALRLARSSHPGREVAVARCVRWEVRDCLVIDDVAQLHLELVTSTSGDKRTTLLDTIDDTKTAAGARLLRRWVLTPLRDVARINSRLAAVEVCVRSPALRKDVRALLENVTDLERLSTRAALGEATARDLGAIRDGLVAARSVIERLRSIESAADRTCLGADVQDVDTVVEIEEVLARALVDRPPAQAKEGAIFRSGYDALLDDADTLRRSGAELIVELETQLKASLAIPSLKLRYTRVFGWYAEVSKVQSSRVPADWRRKQTVATGERFTFPALDELADKILNADEHHRDRELFLLKSVMDQVASAASRIKKLAARVARLDVFMGLGEIAHRRDFTRPLVDDGDSLVLEECRHPVVERVAARGGFVPNRCDLHLGGERMWLITGPNMAGKSTFLRQVALATILAQMGSFVPASRARIGVVDRILSRVGASDNLARGESTFMVEMRETSKILASATRRSLVILDEIGRGTSTFDGLAIAWAVGEYLDEVVGCRTLFATHYHELTELAASSKHIGNRSVSAQEIDGELTFMHRLVEGSVSRSYGVAVAKLAGLPPRVLARARALLAALETGQTEESRIADVVGRHRKQLGLFERGTELRQPNQFVIDELAKLDVESLTPLQALGLLDQWKRQLKSDKA